MYIGTRIGIGKNWPEFREESTVVENSQGPAVVEGDGEENVIGAVAKIRRHNLTVDEVQEVLKEHPLDRKQ